MVDLNAAAHPADFSGESLGGLTGKVVVECQIAARLSQSSCENGTEAATASRD
jgi:hypothetical protein